MRFKYIVKLFMNVPEGGQDLWVEVFGFGPSITLDNYRICLFMVKGRFIGPPAPEGVILVYDIHYPAFNRNSLSLQTLGIAAAVPAFVMGQCYSLGRLEESRRCAVKDPSAYGCMGFHKGELLGVQAGRF